MATLADFALGLIGQQQRGQELQQLQQLRAVQMRSALAEMAQRQRQAQQQQQLETAFGQALPGVLAGLRPLPPQFPTWQPPQVPSYGAGGGMPSMASGAGLPALQRQVLGLEGNRDVFGAAGEIGPGQIMPATGRQYGYAPDQLWGDSGRAASGRIVGDLYQRSGGDPAATLVGYNRGPGAMQRFQAAGDNLAAVPNLAPAYHQAVLADLSPEHQSQAAGVAQTAVPALPYGATPGMAVQLIQSIAGQNVPDEVKGAALIHLLPLMSQEGQRQFQQGWEQYKFGTGQQEKEREFGIRQQETPDPARIQPRARGGPAGAGAAAHRPGGGEGQPR